MVQDVREAWRSFVTGVAMVTTHGRRGPNVMAAEWTFNVSYEPFLIAVVLEEGEATYEAIEETGEFGVNLAAEEQVVAMAFSGHFTHKETEKLTSERFETYPATRIKAPLLRGCVLNAECRVVQKVVVGDHVMLVGEVLAFTVDPGKRPIVLSRGSRHLGERIQRGTALAVAVTPATAAPGGTVTADGEFTAPERGGKAVEIVLLGPGGPFAEAAAVTDPGGYFSATLTVPAGTPPGQYRIVARAEGAESGAGLTLG